MWTAHVSVNHTESDRGAGGVQRHRNNKATIAHDLAEPQTVGSEGRMGRPSQRSGGEEEKLPGRTVEREWLYGFGVD